MGVGFDFLVFWMLVVVDGDEYVINGMKMWMMEV